MQTENKNFVRPSLILTVRDQRNCDVRRKKSEYFFLPPQRHLLFTHLTICNKNQTKMAHGTLEVTIVAGRHLKDEDIVGKNDAYVEIYLDKDYKQRTKTISNSNDPTWNQKFTL